MLYDLTTLRNFFEDETPESFYVFSDGQWEWTLEDLIAENENVEDEDEEEDALTLDLDVVGLTEDGKEQFDLGYFSVKSENEEIDYNRPWDVAEFEDWFLYGEHPYKMGVAWANYSNENE